MHPSLDLFESEVVAPPYTAPPMLAGPFAGNTDGEAVDMAVGRIPAGGINITYCKQVERSSIPGPSNQVPQNVASGDNTPMSGRTVPYGGSGRKPNRGPNDGNKPGNNGNRGPGGGMMVMIMEMIMMIHPSHHLRRRPKSIRGRTRRRRQVVAEEGEMMTQIKILTTVMKSLFDA